MQPLPIDPFVPAILAAVRERRAAVVTAAPGSGKTTRVAPALSVDGPVLLLQPRRVAARSIARRIAEEQAWQVGDAVGWQVRFERRYGPTTRLLVATEGILTARAQADPLLSDFTTVIIDEFHERSLHGDLALALARQAWRAREDFRIVVMSATLDSAPVAAYLDGCPVLEVPGSLHPLTLSYLPGGAVADGVHRALSATSGQVLVFLPGAPEIRRASSELAARLSRGSVEVVQLHGSLTAEEQDEAIRPVAARRVILATNLAETSLTVPGVAAVVDTGLQKVVRFDAARGIDSLETERIALDSATQRAGRAGRLGPGLVVRLWDERDRLRPARQPEIERVDLSGLLLDVLAWGGTSDELEWFEAPPPDALDAAWALLGRLGAVAGRELTDVGRAMRHLPLPPRLARILVAARGTPEAAAACALLAERFTPSARDTTTASDVLAALDRSSARPASFERDRREIERMAASILLGEGNPGEDRARRAAAKEGRSDGREAPSKDRALLRALLAGYPDRVARRRAPGSPRVLLASGHGAVLAPESGVRDAAFLIAVEVLSADPARARGPASDSGGVEARIRVASAIEREWLEPNGLRVEHRFDRAAGVVRAFEQDLYDRLVLAERQVEPDPGTAQRLLADAWLERGLSVAEEQLVNRLAFAGLEADVERLVQQACSGRRRLADAQLADALEHRTRLEVDRLAPQSLPLPSGRSARLEYGTDGSVRAGVKLQEVFGLAESPRLGPRRVPVQFSLLAPNGRPVQLTQDLRSFWDNVYPEVRKELRGRYPRHPWPEDPWAAEPTARAKRKSRT